MSERDATRGPKAAQIYGLTPYGIAESLLHCRAEEYIQALLANWRYFSPFFVQHWKKWDALGLLDTIRQTLQSVYPDVVKPTDYTSQEDNLTPQISFNSWLCVIHRNILDAILIDKIFDASSSTSYDQKDWIFQVIAEDPEYLSVWKRWFAAQQLVFSYRAHACS